MISSFSPALPRRPDQLRWPCYGPPVLVSQSALEASPGAGPSPELPPPTTGAEPGTRRRLVRAQGRWGWLGTAIGLTLLSALVTYWAGTRPGFDPYGWLVWGHQTVHASLDTNAAPSWKPLPWLFTVPYALAGHFELRLWMVTATAISLSGSVFAGRIVYHLVDAPSERRWAAITAGVFAGLAVLGIQGYAHYILSSQSDPMIVSLCLGAIDCHLYRRPRAAFALGVLASLGRPEVWPFLGLYSIWMWMRVPRCRGLLIGGGLAIVVLWFGVPAVTARSPFVAATNALGSGRRLTSDQIFGTIGRFFAVNELPVELAALVGVVIALLRRDRVTLVLAGGVVVWVVIEIAFALHGWPGLTRYMFEAGGVVVVLAGVAVGRLLLDPPPWPSAPAWPSVPACAGPALVVVLVASLVPAAISHIRIEHTDRHEQRARTAEISRLSYVVAGLGGAARLRGCGEPLTRLQYQTMLAYTLGENVNRVGFKYAKAVAHGNPIILFTPRPTGIGWIVQAMHQTSPACRSLPG